MKLALCRDCWDVFKLDFEMRTCKCGKCKGRYIDNTYAEVSEECVSIAIGNGSLQQAIYNSIDHSKTTKNKADRREYYEDGKGRISHAWVRPNTGVGNPHTKIIKEQEDTSDE
jgi:hypothetical protein